MNVFRKCKICFKKIKTKKYKTIVCCSVKCGRIYSAKKRRGMTWKATKTKIKEKEEKRILDTPYLNPISAHRYTIFSGGYDRDGILHGYNEGEIL